ncbi:MAG: flagellar biosynthetic protein FliQ [Pseudomonadota bacterium]
MEISFASTLVGFMIDVGILAGVPLAVATVTGLVISFFQAITQIQDQTLSQTIKITAIAAVLLIFGAALTAPLMNSARMVFDDFHMLTR